MEVANIFLKQLRLHLFVIWTYCCILTIHGDDIERQGGRIQPKPTYMIMAPRVVRPDQVVQVYVNIMDLEHPHINIHAAIRRDGVQCTSVQDTIYAPSSRLLQMKMPESSPPGNYTLYVSGSVNRGLSGALFENVTKLEYRSKHVSVFILTDKLIHIKRQPVHYRIIALKPNLLPVESGTVNIYIKNALGVLMQRNLNRQLFNGYYSGSFIADWPTRFGEWTIEVQAFGHTYRKGVLIDKFNSPPVVTRFSVNISCSTYVFDNEYGLAGTITANMTNFFPVHGNGTLTVEVIPKEKNGPLKGYIATYPSWIYPPKDDGEKFVIQQNIYNFDGISAFSIPLDEVRALVGDDLAGARLDVYATVRDRFFSQEKTNMVKVNILPSHPKMYFLGGSVRTFKPSQTFDCYIAIRQQDGTPLAYKRRQITIVRFIQTIHGSTSSEETVRLIPDNSIVHYSFTTPKDARSLQVRAYFDTSPDTKIQLRATRQYSRSGHYLMVSSSTHQPQVDTYMVFTVRVTTFVPKIDYQIIAGGNILISGVLMMNHRQKTFSLAISRDMVPEAKLMVLCVLNDGEILTDVLNFHVDGIRNDGVKINVNKGKDFSGNTVELNAEADPGSFIVISGADYEMYSRGAATNMFTTYDIEEDLLDYGSHTNTSFKHTWYTPMADDRKNIHYTAPTYAIDANTTFSFAGMHLFTDAHLGRVPDSLLCNVSLGFLPCFDGTCYPVEAQCDTFWNCEDGADEMGCTEDGTTPISTRAFNHFGPTLFNFDSSDWLMHETYVKHDGAVQKKVQVPFRPATWMISAFALSRETGLSFNEQQSLVDTRRQMYIQVEMPSTAYRGEQLGVQVAVYNHWQQSLEVILRLRDSKDYKFVHVEDYGYVHAYNPRTSRGDVQTMVFLRSGESKMIHFPVVPVKIGKVKVIIDAYSLVSKQTQSKTVTVKYDGITNRYHTTYFVDLINSGSIIIPDLWIVVPERFMVANQRYHLYVPGSAKATVSVVGDVMGPGFTSSNLNSGNVAGLTGGQGETVIFDLAVDLIWLRYLKTANQLTTKQLEKSLHSANRDLTIIFAYIDSDGSYKMFRKNSPKSTFLTAYVLETIADAIEAEWEHILYIDRQNVNDIAIWVTSQQDPDTGAFREDAYWYDRKLQDPANMTTADGRSLNISITAYAVISLANSLRHLSGEAALISQIAITKGADYLNTHLLNIWEPFQICITAYALHLANHRAKSDSFSRMRAMQRESEYIYWSQDEIPENPTRIIDTIRFQMPRPDQTGSKAIQGTAYGLMVYLLNSWYRQSIPIMKWLQTQRNFDGGFAGSQDTIHALRALGMFAALDTNRDLYNMVLDIESTSNDDWHKVIHLYKGSYNNYTTFSVPEVFGSIRPRVKGTGFALIQMTVEVNVEYPFLLRQPAVPAFDLVIDEVRFSGRNASQMYMKICSRWLRTDLSPTSGNVIIEAHLPTGYNVDKQELKLAEARGKNPHWRRTRPNKGRVIIHLHFIDSEWTCFDWNAIRWYPVANGTIQHMVRIYEIQEPGNHNTTMYTTYDLFHNHICLVCGSFQCPYCPHYNSSSIITSSYTFILLTLTAVLLKNRLNARNSVL